MSFSSIIFTFIAILIASYYYVNRKYSFWKRHNLPYTKPTFPFGTLNPIKQKLHISEAFAKCYKESKHENVPFIGMYLFFEPFVMALNLDLIKSVLVKDFNYFVNRGLYYNERDDPLSAHIFSIEDQKWRDLRMKLSPTFTSGKMKYMFPTIMTISKEFKSCIDRETNVSSELEFKEIVARFTTDVIGTCAFGIECNSLKTPDTEFRVMGRRAFELKGLALIKAFFTLANRDLARKLGLKILNPVVSKFFLNVVRDTIDFRANNKVERNDFMNLLLNLQKENHKIDGQQLTFEELAAQAFVFWVAGFETSSSVMSYALLELGYNHEIQDRARNEIRSVLQKHNGDFTYEAMMEMKYLGQVINDVGETITETYDHVKDTLSGAVDKVTNGVEDLIHSKKHEVDETVSQETKAVSESVTDTMDKASGFMDDAEALTDKAMRETEDVMNDVFDTTKVSITESIDKDIDKINRELNGSMVNLKKSNSNDSLKLQSPEPEIEKILSNDDSRRSPTPPPTITELPEFTKSSSYYKRESLLTTTIAEENENEIIKSNLNSSNDDNVIKHNDDDDYDFDSIDNNNNNNNNSRSNSLDKDGKGQHQSSPSSLSLPPDVDELTYWEKLADAIVHIPINTFESDLTPITELTDSNENILEIHEVIWENTKE